MKTTTEKAFETHVEEILLGQSGWKSGANAEWNKGSVLFPALAAVTGKIDVRNSSLKGNFVIDHLKGTS